MTRSENRGSTYAYLLKTERSNRKIYSAWQRQLTLLRSIAACTVMLTLLIVVMNLLYNTSISQTEYLPLQTEPLKPFYDVKYKNNKTVTSKSIPPLTWHEMEITRIELKERKKKVEDLCNTIEKKYTNLDSTLSNMVIDVQRGISWCPIYKAGSTTWMKYFAILSGKLTETALDLIERNILQINNIVRQTFPRNPDVNATQEKLSQTKKFLVVRHPIERLVSAYRDKLERIEGREYYYKRFGRHIAYKYHHQKQMNVTKPKPPTFMEFLRFIVEEKYFDEHWAPFYDTCKPCDIHYDYILKFETFDRDQRFLIQELGLNEYLYQENDLRNVNPNGATTRALVKEYLKNIPQILLTQINKVYEKDFMLFSYSLT